MIIGHKLKYLFIEVPHTASTAISRELRRFYGGERILRKHAHYQEFARQASPAERDYFTFAGIRNPLDEAVSLYFKYKNDHHGRYSDPAMRSRNGGNTTTDDYRRFKFIQETGADFSTYFKKFYRWPYSNVIGVSYPSCHFIIRYENLQQDFARVVDLIGAEQVRPLPHINKTQEKAHYLTYYPPEIIEQAKRVFGPFMRRWGYEFPPEWGSPSLSRLDLAQFYGVDVLKNFYWQHIRWSPYLGKLNRMVR